MRGCGILICIVLAGMLALDWPGIKDGIGWLAYANDDMGNFVLFAERVRHHGFFDPPSIEAIISGRDISEFTAIELERPASQIIVALVGSLFNLADPPVFMPVVIALFGAMTAAITAVVYTEKGS